MAWAFNSLAAPVTNTATLITFNMVDALGAAVTAPGVMQVRIVGTGLAYNSATGVMSGTVTSVQLYNNTTSTALQTLTLEGAHQTTAAADVTAFLSHAVTFQSQLTTWAAPAFNNYGTAVETTIGSELLVPLLQGTTLVGFLKVTGDNLYANKPEANGIVYGVELLTAGGIPYVPAKTADYSGPAFSAEGTEMMFDELVYGGKGNWETLFGVFASGNDTLTVNAANTFALDAGIGNDTITGTAGTDTVDYKYATGGVFVDLAAVTDQAEFMDEVTLTTYTQQLSSIENVNGSRYADNLRGNSGANLLWGGNDTEADTLNGGDGNDTYIINDEFDRVSDSAGTDTIRATIDIDLRSFITTENLEMVGSQINGDGNSLDNTITGNSQANVINGQMGSDTMIGGAGNDTYYADDAGDRITETAGNGTSDTVLASTTFALLAAEDIEILKTTSDTGTAAINLTGSSIVNTITGNNGQNRLDGGADSVTDVLNGLLGNDTYVLGAGSDTVNDTGGVDTIESTITRTLASYTTIENLTLTGSSNADATGNASANVLIGNAGNNLITGGAGNDTMQGGTGNDTFVFEANGADIITDFGAKYFTVSMSGSNVVTPSASTATATGGAVMNISNTRLQLDIKSTGLDWNTTSSATNKVTGFGFYQGASTVNGSLTHDILADTSTYKTVNSTLQTVRDVWTTANGLTAPLATSVAAGGHYLEIDTTAFNTPGAIRGQLLANGTAADMISVAGLNITKFATIQELAYDSGTAVVLKRSSNGVANTLTLQNTKEADLLTTHFTYATANVVDNLTGTANADDMFGGLGNDILNGAAGADRLFGEGGNDSLTGGTGNDRMFGGTGNDTFVVDSLADFVNDTAGVDTIQTSLNFSLVNLAAIENLMTTNAAGTTNLTLWGNGGGNQITGNAGNNSIDGKVGADTMTGLGGNDTYFVDNAGDSIIDSSGTADTVKASISYTLGAAVAVEVLQTATTALAINLTGNELAQRVIGSNAVNTLNGGAGNDTMTGYAGNDFFVFNTALNTSTNRDTITDFNPVADTFRLENTGTDLFNTLGTGTLAASRFVVGTAALDSADRIIYNKATGVLSYDADGSGAGAAIQFAILTNKATLTNADFVVI